MNITFRNRFWDIFWFNLYQMPRSRTNQVAFAIPLLFFVYVFFQQITDPDPKFSILVKVLIALTIILPATIGGIMFMLVFVSINIFINRQNRQLMQSDSQVEITEEGVRMECSTGHSDIKWLGIERVVRTSRYILINLSDQMGCVIPKRAFVDDQNADSFFDYAHERWARAKSSV